MWKINEKPKMNYFHAIWTQIHQKKRLQDKSRYIHFDAHLYLDEFVWMDQNF